MALYEAGSGPGVAASAIGTATTDATGAFTISGAMPTSGAFLYAIATGGNANGGTGANGAIALMTTLGPVTNFPASVTINELTTVASSYAMAQFFYSETDLRDSATPELTDAFAAIGNLVNMTSGAAGPGITSSSPDNSGSLMRMNTLANAMAACAESASSSSTACSNLCFAASVAGTCDTLAAAQTVAHQPAIGTLFGAGGIQSLGATGPYTPTLTADPTDWTLSLAFNGNGTLAAPNAVAIDAAGNVWVTNSSSGVLTELAPNGTPIALPTPTPSLIIPEQLAFDSSGALWIRDVEGGTLDKYDPATGTTPVTIPFTGSGGFAVDGSDNLLVTDNSNSVVDGYTSGGMSIGSPYPLMGNGLLSPGPIVVDSSGNIWVANAQNFSNPTAPSTLSEFTSSGAAASGSPFSDPSLSNPNAMAIGPHPAATSGGMIWITDAGSLSASSSATPAVTIADISTSPPSFLSTSGVGGLSSPQGVAVDSAGNGWITNYTASGPITELDSSAVPLSPASGFTGPGLDYPFGIAIDGAGNVWVANSGGTTDTVTEFIGAAGPVVPPVISQPTPGGVPTPTPVPPA